MTRREWQDLGRGALRRARHAGVAVLVALNPRRHVRDVHVYGGLAVAALGGWQLSPACTKLGVGLVLMVFGVFVPRRPPAAPPAEE